MGKRSGTKKRASRFLGTYTLPYGQSAFGELRLNGSTTLLKLHSEICLVDTEPGSCVKGMAYTGEYLTLIDCIGFGMGQASSKNAPTRYYADIFPHHVAIGRRHIDPNLPCISSIQFTTTDLAELFYDYDAFNSLIDATPIMDEVLSARRQQRPVEAGERPIVCYFTGKECITEIFTAIGKISVHHQPRYNMGGPKGVYIKNRIVVSIEPDHPVTFNDAISRMHDIACFLSVAAGRVQGVNHTYITLNEADEAIPVSLTIYSSHRWEVRDKSEQRKPRPFAVPLDPIRRRTEFDTVLRNWVFRHSSWRVARFRYLDCLRKGNMYDSDRLVAAANMFDILPAEALPQVAELPAEIVETRDASAKMFRKLPPGVDRNGALSAIGRLGKPSLPKKVAYRVSIVESKLGNRFPELQFVASIAVRCRNFLVHGSTDDFDYPKFDPFLPFLIDALEFVFAVSDFIEVGWDANQWNSSQHTWGHSFSRFRSEYSSAIEELRRVAVF